MEEDIVVIDDDDNRGSLVVDNGSTSKINYIKIKDDGVRVEIEGSGEAASDASKGYFLKKLGDAFDKVAPVLEGTAKVLEAVCKVLTVFVELEKVKKNIKDNDVDENEEEDK